MEEQNLTLSPDSLTGEKGSSGGMPGSPAPASETALEPPEAASGEGSPENAAEAAGEDTRAELLALRQQLTREKEDALAEAEETFALRLALERAGCLDSLYLAGRLKGQAVFQDGVLQNGDELLDKARKTHPVFFPRPKVEGVRPAEGIPSGRAAYGRLSLRQRAGLFKRDPEGYRAMRAAE